MRYQEQSSSGQPTANPKKDRALKPPNRNQPNEGQSDNPKSTLKEAAE
jgi:hypothetical protein